jgi:hypothetical protein
VPVFITGLLVALVVGAAGIALLWGLSGTGSRGAANAATNALDGIDRIYKVLEAERYERLGLLARQLADGPEVAALLSPPATEPGTALPREPPVTPLLPRAAGRPEGALVAILDAGGATVRVEGAAAGSAEPFELLRQERAVGPGQSRAGVLVRGGTLYYAHIQPVTRTFTLLGFVMVGLPTDDLLARQIRPVGGHAVFLTLQQGLPGPVARASSAVEVDTGRIVDRLVAAMRAQPTGAEAYGRVFAQGEPLADLRLSPLSLGGPEDEAFQALLVPVLTPAASRPAVGGGGGGTGAALLLITPLTFKDDAFPQAALALGAAFLLALLLSALLAARVGRRSHGPMEQLLGLVQKARAGEISGPLPFKGSGAAAQLAAILSGWMAERREERELETAVAEAMAAGGGDATAPAAAAERIDSALLAVELRRFARGTDAEEAGRDLERALGQLRSVARARGGSVDGVAGHRALVVFAQVDAEQRVRAALGAAAEFHRLSIRPVSVFDEREEVDPPTLAVVSGKLIRAAGARGPVVLGLPVQQAESLLKEAVPGELVLSREVEKVLRPRLEGLGIQPKGQQGVLSPQPFFSLPPAAAAQVAGDGLGEETSPGGLLLAVAAVGDLEPGEAVGERFEIRERLGTGPAATTYRAYDREFGRTVALKTFRPDALVEPRIFERLDSPLQGLRTLTDPRIARTYDFGSEGGVPFVTRQLVGGISLGQWVERTGPVAPGPALSVARQMAEALAAAHRDQVVHGRLYSGNVLLEPGGQVVVTDFGTARVIKPGTGGAYLAYQAPETRDRGHTATADVYAWGRTVLELISGRSPATGRLEAPRWDQLGLPPAVRAVLEKSLDPDPEQRFKDGGALLQALLQARSV